jgi:hypothetical protein
MLNNNNNNNNKGDSRTTIVILISAKHKNLKWIPRRSRNIDATTTGLKSMKIN